METHRVAIESPKSLSVDLALSCCFLESSRDMVKIGPQERSKQGLIYNTSNPGPGHKLFPTRER